MSTGTPPNFVDLSTASHTTNAEVNIIGVVTDFLPPSRSRGTDWVCTFSISDHSHGQLGDMGNEGLKVRFFKPMESELPAIRGTGDVVVLRNVKIKQWNGMTMALASYVSTWAVIHAFSIPETVPSGNVQLQHAKGPRAPAPSISEMLYAIEECNSHDRSSYSSLAALPKDIPVSHPSNRVPTATQGRREKFSLIKDMAIDTYYDIVGQVVKCYPTNGRVELYLTDYTPNQLLYFYEWGQDDNDEDSRDGDAYGYLPRSSTKKKWPGPFGKLTLRVTLWPPHSSFAQQNLKENDFVHLRNMHVKFDKDSKMEGGLHSDRRHQDRVDVTILKDNRDDDRVKDVLRRKKEYHRKFNESSEKFVVEAREVQNKQGVGIETLSKGQARKQRRHERETENPTRINNTASLITKRKTACNEENKLPPDSPPSKYPRLDLNKSIHTSHHLIPPRPLSSVVCLDSHANTTPDGTAYTLPFQNINTRTTVRIIGFFPPKVVDFAVPSRKHSEYAVLSDHEDSSSSSSNSFSVSSTTRSSNEEQNWEWRFALILEDATAPKNSTKAIITAYVVGQDAECLLKLDAQDLRKSPKALATLREKLSLMWGDLEKRETRKKRGHVLAEVDGNKSLGSTGGEGESPFVCCLKEYGVKVKVEAKGQSIDENISDGDESEEAKVEWKWERRWRLFGCTIV